MTPESLRRLGLGDGGFETGLRPVPFGPRDHRRTVYRVAVSETMALGMQAQKIFQYVENRRSWDSEDWGSGLFAKTAVANSVDRCRNQACLLTRWETLIMRFSQLGTGLVASCLPKQVVRKTTLELGAEGYSRLPRRRLWKTTRSEDWVLMQAYIKYFWIGWE